jgi:hypothetical protein
MENKMKTAEEIVLTLALSDEPYFISDDKECYCTLCQSKGDDDQRVRLLPEAKLQTEDGLSFMGHDEKCAWRQAIEYVRASQKKPAKKGKRK